mgnify:FL=1
MQGEQRVTRMGRRYFGRDLTNIEDGNKGNREQEVIGTSKIGAYKPLITHIPSRSHIPMESGITSTTHIQEERTSRPAKTAQGTPMQSFKTNAHGWPLKDSPDNLRQSQERTYSPMQMERLDNNQNGLPHLPSLLKDTDNIYAFNKQMNFPGSDFLDFNGIPYSCIWSHLIFKRNENVCLNSYLAVQRDLNEEMREIVVDWLVDVHRKFKMRTETLFMALSLMGRYLTRNEIKKEVFQLVATTSLFIASKFEEIYPPVLDDFVYICADAYSKSDILNMEALMLNDLQFGLVNSSPPTLLGIYTAQKFLPRKQYDLCLYFLHVLEMSYKMLEYNPAVRVAACINLSSKILKTGEVGIDVLSKDFSAPQEQIRKCGMDLFLQMCAPPNEKLTAVRRKFSLECYSHVAALKITLKGLI